MKVFEVTLKASIVNKCLVEADTEEEAMDILNEAFLAEDDSSDKLFETPLKVAIDMESMKPVEPAPLAHSKKDSHGIIWDW